ncbi:MAG: LuxR C-terminal-related transcriptional regulator [Eubacteriales bacterium]|nr:LuxR C-terminal-related transcriptional regulator [Eubacteriales bacterium]
MVPKADYDRARFESIAQTILLLVLLLFFTVSFCRYFSRRFLSPLLSALEQIKSDKRDEAGSDIPEILDLIEYLDRQDKAHGETVSALTLKHQTAENEKIRLQAEYEAALNDFNRIETEYCSAQSELNRIQMELERLAYSRKNEIDPADYQYFLAGLQTLTEAERNVFEYYLAGKSAKEILALTGIKESTLKYHNHNILGKLGVSSRKQMLRYAEVMRNQKEEDVT